MKVEKEAYSSNHDDAEPMFVNEEEKEPNIEDLMVCVNCDVKSEWRMVYVKSEPNIEDLMVGFVITWI
jgi:hypothetical protein